MGVIRDKKNKVVVMIIEGNGAISEEKSSKYTRCGIERDFGCIRADKSRQVLPNHNNALEDSPTAKLT